MYMYVYSSVVGYSHRMICFFVCILQQGTEFCHKIKLLLPALPDFNHSTMIIVHHFISSLKQATDILI